jgi:glycerophosphoryl diester phosphodiesterase
MLIIGHRGARGLAPENTIAALKKGIEYHADMLEIDTRVTKDGVPVVHHDPYIVDASGSKLVICDHTLSELQAHKPDLARLEDTVRFVHGQVPLVIEIKPDEPLEPILRCLRHLLSRDIRSQDLLIASFSFSILQAVHGSLPDVPLIVNERWSGVRASWRAGRLRTSYIAMNARWLWRPFIRSMSKRGYRLLTYTLNDPQKARSWQQAGLAGLYTDYPDRFQPR